MARIYSIDYSRFGNENYLSFSRETCTIIQAFAIIGQRFGFLVSPYEAAVERLDEAMKQPTWSDLTAPIAEKDAERDRVLISFKALVESMRHYSPVEGVTADAEKVYRFIKLNHVNPAAQYDKETAQISNLLQDLERYCQQEVERMGVQPTLTVLKTLNEEMAQLLAERDIQDSVKKEEAVKQARRACDGLYVALKDSVNAAALVDSEGTLTAFIAAMNQMLKRLEVQVLKVPVSGAGGVDSDTDGEGGSAGSGSGEGEGGSGSGEGGSTGGSGEGGSTGGSTGGSQEEQEYTVTYYGDNGKVITTQRYQVGQTIVPPTPPAGFEWGYLPNVMPARDLNVYPIDPETGA